MNNRLKIILSSLFLFSLSSCFKEPDFHGKAIVLLEGERGINTHSNHYAIVAFKSDNDSVVIEQVKTPNFKSAIFAGDSLEIIVTGQNIECTKLYSIKNNSTKPYVYSAQYQKAYFNDGILILGNYEYGQADFGSMDFYNYKINKGSNKTIVMPIGYSNDTAFIFNGLPSHDTLEVIGYNQFYVLNK